MSAGQNHQSLRILAPASEHLQRLNITLSQVVHDLTFILFAAAHFMSLFATKFLFGASAIRQNYLYEICFD